MGQARFPQLKMAGLWQSLWQGILLFGLVAIFPSNLPFAALAETKREQLIAYSLACCHKDMSIKGDDSASNTLQLKTDDGEKAKLIVRLSHKVEADMRVLSDPDRILLDLPDVAFRFDKDDSTQIHQLSKTKDALIAGFRYGLVANGRARLVILLANPAIVTSLTQIAVDPLKPEGESVLVLECTKATRPQFLAALTMFAPDPLGETPTSLPHTASSLVPLAGASSLSSGSQGLTRPVIVIDPGHGGIDTGAIGHEDGEGAALVEKELVFAFAQTLAQKLKDTQRYDVVLTRTSDIFVPLAERVKIAERVGAQLFISIHADSLSGGRGASLVSGATVYTLSDKASDSEAAKIAQHENAADLTAGIKTSEAPPEVDDILFDLTRRETRLQSHSFANYLVNLMGATTPLNKNPTRAAGFQVLKAPDIPSTLVELGYLSSSQDGKRLASAAWRNSASESILAAVDSFFAHDGAAITPSTK